MELIDTRKNIIWNADKSVQNLTNICSVDKLSKEICSSLDFWAPLFEEYNFPLPKIIPSNHVTWISTFEKERMLKIGINRLMEILKNPNEQDFERLEQEYIDELPSIGLLIYQSDAPFLDIFGDIEGVDINQLLSMINDRIMHKCQGKDQDNLAFANVFFDRDQKIYSLNITDFRYKTKTEIDRDTAKRILYRILSYGTIPRDDQNGDPVRMVKDRDVYNIV